jgi:hypothetical protein
VIGRLPRRLWHAFMSRSGRSSHRPDSLGQVPWIKPPRPRSAATSSARNERARKIGARALGVSSHCQNPKVSGG